MGKDVAASPTTKVIDSTEKFAFASSAWVDFARTVLEELVAEHGKPGRSFSACEVFEHAPEGLAGPERTTAAWHFSIEGMTVIVGEGEIDSADFNPRAGYESALPIARLVYTPDALAKMERDRPRVDGESSGDRDANQPPGYLIELHNRMAAVTQ